MDDGRPLYDVDPAWSPERKEAFALYRDMGPERNLRAVAQVCRKDPSLMMRWSRQDAWVRRVAAWDVYQDKLRQEDARIARLRITTQHAESLDTTLRVITAPAVELARRMEQGELDLKDMTVQQLLEASTIIGRVMPRIVVASRLVHGMTTSDDGSVKSDQQRMIENASIEELDDLLTGLPLGDEQTVRKALNAPPSEHADSEE